MGTKRTDGREADALRDGARAEAGELKASEQESDRRYNVHRRNPPGSRQVRLVMRGRGAYLAPAHEVGACAEANTGPFEEEVDHGEAQPLILDECSGRVKALTPRKMIGSIAVPQCSEMQSTRSAADAYNNAFGRPT